jgi:hypothetical protein
MVKNLIDYVVIMLSGHFDRNYYLKNYPDIRQADINPLWHFVKTGWRENRNPSSEFNIKSYVDSHPEVKILQINPLIHFIRYGKGKIKATSRNDIRESPTGQLIEKPQIKNNAGLPISFPKITLYLHIGDTKTGSSLIQNFLDVNRTNLIKYHNCLYPNLYSEDMASGRCHNHGEWYKSVKENTEKTIADELLHIIAYARSRSLSSVVLSFEEWLFLDDFMTFFKEAYQTKNMFQPKIIVFIRRTDLWCESAWKQWGLKTATSIEEFIKDPIIEFRLKYTLRYLDKWADIVGLDNILIKPYEKQQLGKGLIEEFLSLIGISYESHKWNNTEEINLATNSGFNRDVLEILHHCQGLFSDVHDNNLFDLFSILLDNHFIKQPFESYAFLSPSERIRIHELNLPYEKKIASKFLRRENGKVFYDPIPNAEQPWAPYSGLTLEKVIPIFVKMVYETNNRIDNIIKLINDKK